MNRAQLFKGKKTIVNMEGEHLFLKDFIVETILLYKLIVSEVSLIDIANGWSEKYTNGEVELFFKLVE